MLRRDVRYPEPIGGWPLNCELFYYKAEEWEHPDFDKALVPHHNSLENLQSNARSCELCRLIEGCVSETLGKMKKLTALGFRNLPDSNYTFWLSGRYQADGFQIIGRHDELRHQYRIMGGAGICVRDDSPLTGIVSGRLVPPDPMLPSVLAKITNWIQHCEESHGHVQRDERETPTRILKIKDNGQTISLCEGTNIEGGYAALSYCWGSDRPLTLNAGSFTKLVKGMKIVDLPKTFQDAVWVISQLGLSHLWIDSLCIFQDDPSDWARESGRMAKVYGNSTVTIAASRAACSSEGFLGKRTPRIYVAVPFRDDHVSGELLIFPLHVRNVGDTSRYVRLEDEPLTSRGWVLQERYLSPRTIHFGNSQVCFECTTAFIPEDGCSASPSRWNWQYSLPNAVYWETEWKQVVGLYSQRNLSVTSDKLPAVAGIAEYFAKIAAAASVDNRYLAGLWQNDIILNLCWYIDIRKHYQRRSGQYRAPTWSWASLNASISFAAMKYPLATFQKAHVDLDTPDSPFGKTTGGWIKLQARKCPLSSKTCDNGDLVVTLFAEGPNCKVPVIWEDEKMYNAPSMINDSPQKTPFVAIPLAWREYNIGSDVAEFSVFCIIAKAASHTASPCAGVQPFQRVGSADLKLRKSDERYNFESFGLHRWMTGSSDCIQDGLEDVILV